jgi:DNA-binding response OmpR family regulator
MTAASEVLFVDDEATIRITFPLMLQKHGFKVTAAATVAEALKLIGERQFDVLISDLNIHRAGDGFALVNAMRSTQPKAVRFILTGYPDFESALNALREGVDDYLIKPSEVEDVVAKIRSRLERRSSRQEILAKPLSAVVGRERESITSKWLALAKQDADLKRIELPDIERTDHLPHLLAVSIGILEGKAITTENKLAAAQHGETRFNQGYLPALLVREAKLLQDAISDCVQRNLLEIQVSTLIPGMVRVFGTVQTLLEESLSAFLQAQHSGR